jgi:hypothetical protein
MEVTTEIQDASDVMTLFSSNASFDQHCMFQDKDIQKYMAALKLLEQNGADIAQSKYWPNNINCLLIN